MAKTLNKLNKMAKRTINFEVNQNSYGSGSGSGCGYGDGCGYGHGDGCGDGYGYGDGNGGDCRISGGDIATSDVAVALQEPCF
jgi:hypothetical protein